MATAGETVSVDLWAVNEDIALSRQQALSAGAEVCHVREIDGELFLIRETASPLRISEENMDE